MQLGKMLQVHKTAHEYGTRQTFVHAHYSDCSCWCRLAPVRKRRRNLERTRHSAHSARILYWDAAVLRGRLLWPQRHYPDSLTQECQEEAVRCNRSLLVHHFCDWSTFLGWFSLCTTAASPSLLDCYSGHRPHLVVERVGIWEGREWLLGPSKRTYVSYDRDDIRSSELYGSVGLLRDWWRWGIVLGHIGPHSGRTGRNFTLTKLHEQQFSFTQDFVYCLLCVNTKLVASLA
jgi:hypothetical protein